MARACGGVDGGVRWTGAGPTSADLEVVYAGHGRRDGADDRIVALVAELGSGARALVYTFDARLRARVLLARCAAAGDRDTREGSRGALSGG